MALPTIGPNPRHLQQLKIGGGYNSTPDGGADFDPAGNIAADGDLTVDGNTLLKGTLDVTGNIGTATFDGDLLLGTNGTNKLWTKWIGPTEIALQTGSPPATGVVQVSEAIIPVLDFDQTTTEFIGFAVDLGQDYDGSALKFTTLWTAASGTGAVVWTWEPYILDVGETIGTAASDYHRVTIFVTANTIHADTFAVTPTGAATGNLLTARIRRNTAHGSDTLTADARLIGVSISYA